MPSKKTQRLLIGLILGAIVGAGLAAIASSHDTDENSGISKLRAGDWVKLGISALGIARQLVDFLESA